MSTSTLHTNAVWSLLISLVASLVLVLSLVRKKSPATRHGRSDRLTLQQHSVEFRQQRRIRFPVSALLIVILLIGVTVVHSPQINLMLGAESRRHPDRHFSKPTGRRFVIADSLPLCVEIAWGLSRWIRALVTFVLHEIRFHITTRMLEYDMSHTPFNVHFASVWLTDRAERRLVRLLQRLRMLRVHRNAPRANSRRRKKNWKRGYTRRSLELLCAPNADESLPTWNTSMRKVHGKRTTRSYTSQSHRHRQVPSTRKERRLRNNRIRLYTRFLQCGTNLEANIVADHLEDLWDYVPQTASEIQAAAAEAAARQDTLWLSLPLITRIVRYHVPLVGLCTLAVPFIPLLALWWITSWLRSAVRPRFWSLARRCGSTLVASHKTMRNTPCRIVLPLLFTLLGYLLQRDLIRLLLVCAGIEQNPGPTKGKSQKTDTFAPLFQQNPSPRMPTARTVLEIRLRERMASSFGDVRHFGDVVESLLQMDDLDLANALEDDTILRPLVEDALQFLDSRTSDSDQSRMNPAPPPNIESTIPPSVLTHRAVTTPTSTQHNEPTPSSAPCGSLRPWGIKKIATMIKDWDVETTFSCTWRFQGHEFQTHDGIVTRRTSDTVFVKYSRMAADGTDVETTLPPESSAVHILKLVPTHINAVPEMRTDHSSVDNDYDGVPTATTIQPLHRPVFVGGVRDILRNFATNTTSEQETQWHAFLSYTKIFLRSHQTLSQAAGASSNQNMHDPAVKPDAANSRRSARIAGKHAAASEHPGNDPAIRKIWNLVRNNFVSRACRLLERVHRLKQPIMTILTNLRALHPKGRPFTPPPVRKVWSTISNSEIDAALSQVASGAAPGVSGMTDQMLIWLFEDPLCRIALVDMLRQILNNDLPSSHVRTRITRCRLLGLPKKEKGTRPIAIGDSLLKLAGRLALNRCRSTVNKHFAPLQFGYARDGTSTVLHRARDRYENGHHLLTIDMRNAFNCPDRKCMLDALLDSELELFFNLFLLEYANPSELLVFDGYSLSDIIMSLAGTRQGSFAGGLFFSLVLHPILVKAAKAFPTVNIMAYLDDITLTSPDERAVSACFEFIQEAVSHISLVFNLDKCEWFSLVAACPARLVSLGVKDRAPDGRLKLLGGWIGRRDVTSAAFRSKLDEHKILFDRLAQMPPSPQAFQLLRLCALPRLEYFMATHEPEVVLPFAREFDSFVVRVIECWTDAAIPMDNALLWLPLHLGGIGLRRMEEVAAASYNASLSRAIPGKFPTPPPSLKSVRAGLANSRLDEIASSTILDAHRLAHCHRDCSRWLSAVSSTMCSRSFATALRLRLRLPHRLAEPEQCCYACTANPSTEALAPADFDWHCVACPRRSGLNCTTKHNVVRDWVFNKLRSVGYLCILEPRIGESFTCCGGCKKSDLRASDLSQHVLHCGGRTVRSGPDILVTLQDRATYLDVSCVHDTTRHYLSQRPCADVFDAVNLRKERKYAPLLPVSSVLRVVAFTAAGHLSKPFRDLLNIIATSSGGLFSFDDIAADISVVVQQANAAAVVDYDLLLDR